MAFKINSTEIFGDDGNVSMNHFQAYTLDNFTTSESYVDGPSNALYGEGWGHSVAVGQGILAVGAFQYGGPATSSGAVLVYKINLESNQIDDGIASANALVLQPPNSQSYGRFGEHIALSGRHLIISYKGYGTYEPTKGGFYIWDLANEGSNSPTFFSGARYGYALDASADRFAMGTYIPNTQGNSDGSVRIYDINGSLIKNILPPAGPEALLLNAGYNTVSGWGGDGKKRPGFGVLPHSVGIGCGRIVVGSPTEDSNKGALLIYDINANFLKKVKWGTAEGELGSTVRVNDGRIVAASQSHQAFPGYRWVTKFSIFDLNGKLIETVTPENSAKLHDLAVGCGYIFAATNDTSGGAIKMYDLWGNQLKAWTPTGYSSYYSDTLSVDFPSAGHVSMDIFNNNLAIGDFIADRVWLYSLPANANSYYEFQSSILASRNDVYR